MAEPDLSDKVALITGGAHRIGATIAHALHARGMQLVIHYHSSEAAAHALQEELLTQRAGSVLLIRGDLSNGDRLTRNLVHETIEKFGRLDLVVNNAARFYPTPVGSVTDTQWDDIVDTNLKAPYFLSQAAAPHLRKHGGCIVNIADIYGERPLPNHPVYSIAKAGLIMLTKSLARELAPDVRVNAIAPGAILWPEHEMDEMAQQRIISRTPLKRTGDPSDIVRALLYFLCDGAFVTGQVLNVDGGRSVVV